MEKKKRKKNKIVEGLENGNSFVQKIVKFPLLSSP